MSVRILVIEDEPDVGDFVVRGLREEGYTVEWAADGAAGWHHLSAESWDVVLLDWWLPGLDGLNLLQRFRKTNATTPVLFLTARDAVADRVKGLDAGANDYLCKPFAFAELLARVRVLTRPTARPADVAVAAADVRADLLTQRVTRADRPVPLTAKEYALLLFFLRNPGVVLSRTRIYEAVWDERYDGLSNTLEVHLMDLRRKLEAHGPRLIHTLRHRGYVFGDRNE
jgi:DNA-binding response OmpR family regulator